MKKKWFNAFVITAGVILCLSTLLLPALDSYRVSKTLQTFESEAVVKDTEKQEQMQKDAEEYNSMLFQTQASGVNLSGEDILSEESYNSLYDYGNGLMGVIEIPKISLKYPLYHGTSDEVLNKGIGHLRTSSLPTGTAPSHAVFSGHRGLPTAKLFTRLDEMEKGDLFFITIGDQKMAYRVNDIRVVEPNDMSVSKIEPDKDLVSLVTCTPYGINTHRLIVTGERVAYTPQEEEAIQKSLPSLTEMLVLAAPFGLIFAILTLWIDRNKRERLL